jgi:hypothetical protein
MASWALVSASCCVAPWAVQPGRSETSATKSWSSSFQEMIGSYFGVHTSFPLIASGVEVVSRLHVQPVFGRGPEIAGEAQGGFSGDGALSGEDRADPVGGYVDLLGQAIHAEAEVVEGLLEDDAWMNGREFVECASCIGRLGHRRSSP